MEENRPHEDIVASVVARVEPVVINGIKLDRRRKRRLAVGASVLAGLGLFAAGVVVGAAALPPITNPGTNPGTTVDGSGRVQQDQFAIDCYASTSAASPNNTMIETVEPGAAPTPAELSDERHPDLVCAHMEDQGNVDGVVSAEAANLIASGIDEGFIRVAGDRIYHFEKDKSGRVGDSFALGIDDGAETSGASVTISATIPAPAPSTVPSAVCAVGSNWVKVYPLDGRTAAATCAGVGLSPWRP